VGIPHLTTEQHKAVYLLLSGHSVNETAALVKRTRETVSRWKALPHFEVALNALRLEMFDALRNRLQSMAKKAVDVMEQHLNDGSLTAAANILRIIDMPKQLPPQSNEVDASAIIKNYVEELVRRDSRSKPFSGQATPNEFMRKVADDLAEQLRLQYVVDSPLTTAISELSNESK